MRLEKIVVRNFRTIREAVLTDLPAEGIVAVVGPNESGKTSLAEAVGFAFYGRSVRDAISVGNLIRWGHDRLEVELVFRIETERHPRRRYVLHRELDRLGEHLVTLRELEPGDERVSGIDEVGRRLRALGVAPFDLFRSLTYLHAPLNDKERRQALLEEVAGVTALTRAADQVREDIQGREREFSLLVQELERKNQNAERLRVSAETLPEVEEKVQGLREQFENVQGASQSANDLFRSRRRLADRWHRHTNRLGGAPHHELGAIRAAVEKTEELLDKEKAEAAALAGKDSHGAVAGECTALRAFLTEYDAALEDGAGKRRRQQELLAQNREEASAQGLAIRSQNRRKWGALLTASLAALVAIGGSVALYFLLEGKFSAIKFSSPVIIALAVGGTGLLVGVVAFFAYLARAFQLERLREEFQVLLETAGELERSIADIERSLEDAVDLSKWALVRQALGAETPAAVEDPTAAFSSLARRVKQLSKARRDETGKAESEYRSKQEALRKDRSNRDRAESELRDKRNAAQKLTELEDETGRIQDDIDGREEVIDVHLLALELIENTIAQIRLRAVPALCENLRQVISPVTGGMYREVRLSADLTAEVFASLKGDFLTTTELSGATRSGVDLSIGAAMAALLAQSRHDRGHFILVDYPVN